MKSASPFAEFHAEGALPSQSQFEFLSPGPDLCTPINL
jgi:hypothetical protein